MMSFEKLNEMVSNRGFRRSTTAKTLREGKYEGLKAYDYRHRKKYDTFSIYVDEFGAVKFSEYTEVNPRTLETKVHTLYNSFDHQRFFENLAR